MKQILLFFFLVFSFINGVSSSWQSSIKANYYAHPIIFYGEFLGCYELANTYDIYGYPVIIQNYKVHTKIKGFETLFDDSVTNDTISIRHTEYKLNRNYCSFLNGKKFIVYAANRTYNNSTSFPYFHPTFPTREIIDNDFTVKESLIRDEIGKNELSLLIDYKSKDTTDYKALKRQAYNESEYYQGIIAEQKDMIAAQKEEIHENNTAIKILVSIIIVALLVSSILFFRK